MKVHVVDRQSDLLLAHKPIQKLVKAVIAHEGQKCDEVCLYFVSTKEICDLHESYFDDPSPTDCISFPLDNDDPAGPRVLGDVFVCPKMAVEYTQTHGGNPFHEVALYIIHGLLHLMGYDDIAATDKRKMRAAEKRHLAHLLPVNMLDLGMA